MGFRERTQGLAQPRLCSALLSHTQFTPPFLNQVLCSCDWGPLSLKVLRGLYVELETDSVPSTCEASRPSTVSQAPINKSPPSPI